MSKYRWPVFVAAVAMALPVVATGAGASATHGPSTAQVIILGQEIFRPNFFQQTFRFPDAATVIRSGGTVTWNNKSSQPHSISLVAKGDLPKSTNGNDVQNVLFGAHNLNGPPPFTVVVDGGQPNDDPTQTDVDTLTDFDTVSHSNPSAAPTVGDSVLIDTNPPSFGFAGSISVLVTAPAGTTLDYFCIFHPQMQGQIKVVG